AAAFWAGPCCQSGKISSATSLNIARMINWLSHKQGGGEKFEVWENCMKYKNGAVPVCLQTISPLRRRACLLFQYAVLFKCMG
ncbi:hypothetical protein, partial [Escherichia coli]